MLAGTASPRGCRGLADFGQCFVDLDAGELVPAGPGAIHDLAHSCDLLVFEPPTRFVISWDLNPQWQVEADPEKTSEVEVRFVPETPERTRIELEHRNLHRHGDGWEWIRGSVGSEGGWPGCLRRFAERVAA